MYNRSLRIICGDALCENLRKDLVSEKREIKRQRRNCLLHCRAQEAETNGDPCENKIQLKEKGQRHKFLGKTKSGDVVGEIQGFLSISFLPGVASTEFVARV